MLVSYEHQFLFIQVNKTAGSSIDRALAPYCEKPETYWMNRLLDRVGIHVNHYAPLRHKRFRRHTSARVVRRHFPRDVYDGLFKFAFVRNPWDWLVSLYHYVSQRSYHHQHRKVAALESFDDFLALQIERYGHRLQSNFVVDRHGKTIVDFIGRYENLETDFAHVCRTIGVQASLGKVNASVRRDYRDYYSPRTADLVARAYRADVERFGYAFRRAA